MKKVVFVIFVFFVSLFTDLYAQDGTIGPVVGATSYYGELNQIPYRIPSYYVGLRYRNSFNDRIAFRLEGIYGNLKGNGSVSLDPYTRTLGQSFSTGFGEIGMLGEFNFFKFEKDMRKPYYYTPYLVGGVSLLIVPDPYHAFNFSFPIGIGFKYLVSEKVTVGVEFTYRWTYSDYLDIIPPDDYSSIQRSYNTTPDSYSLLGVFINYQVFKYQTPCPAYPY